MPSRGGADDDVVAQFRWELRSGLMFAIYFSLPWFLFAICSCMNICCGTPPNIGSSRNSSKKENNAQESREFDHPGLGRAISEV